MKIIFKTGDICIILIILLLTLLMLILPCFERSNHVVVYADGKEYGRYSLDTKVENTFKIETEHGVILIEIKDGKVSVLESSCKDKLEISAGEIDRAGQSLVCLPNRVVITIEGGTKTDATTF